MERGASWLRLALLPPLFRMVARWWGRHGGSHAPTVSRRVAPHRAHPTRYGNSRGWRQRGTAGRWCSKCAIQSCRSEGKQGCTHASASPHPSASHRSAWDERPGCRWLFGRSELGRQLTRAEISLARRALDSAISALAARLGATEDEQKEVPPQEPAGGAALAAASWGSWRNRAPTDARARARHVLVDTESQALCLLKELTFGADMAQLAAEHSACPSKENGGDLGVFVPGDMAAEFDAFVFDSSTAIGIPLGPVKTPFGFHIVIVDERTGDV